MADPFELIDDAFSGIGAVVGGIPGAIVGGIIGDKAKDALTPEPIVQGLSEAQKASIKEANEIVADKNRRNRQVKLLNSAPGRQVFTDSASSSPFPFVQG